MDKMVGLDILLFKFSVTTYSHLFLLLNLEGL